MHEVIDRMHESAAPNASFRSLAGTLAFAWAALNLPLLLGFRVLPGDAMFEFYPMVYFNAQSIREGLAPWWNPYIFAGYPHVADPQAMTFSPLMMAWMLLRSEPNMPWFVAGALLHVYLGGVSMIAVLRRLNTSDLGALLGALVFMGGGVAASRLQHVPILIVYSFIPLAVLCLLRLAEAPHWSRAGVVGVIAAAMLVQPAQLTFFAGLMLPAYAVTLGATRWRGWESRTRLRYAGGLILAATVAGLLAAPQLLFTYAFLLISNRPELPLVAATDMSLSWSAFSTFLLPNALGSLRGTYSGPVDPIETFFWVGAVPMVVLMGGLGKAWQHVEHRRYLLLLLVVSTAACIYMLGSNTPVYELLYKTVPGVKQFRRPSDAAYLLNLAVAFAVALSATHLDVGSVRVRLALTGAASAWLLFASLTMRGFPERWQATTILAPVIATVVTFALRYRAGPRSVQCGFILICVADYRAFGMNGEFNQLGDRAARFLRSEASHVLSATMNDHRDRRAMLSARMEAVDMPASWKNNVVLKQLHATHGYGPLRWAIWDRTYGAFADGNGPRPTAAHNLTPASKVNQLLGVRYVVAPTESPLPWLRPGEGRVRLAGKAKVVELSGALPRVLSPTESILTERHGNLDDDLFGVTDFTRTVLLTPRSPDELPALHEATNRCTGGVAHVLKQHATNTRVTLEVRTKAPAWIVLTDLDFPGWTTAIDANIATHFRANRIVRAVCVPAGDHTVTFRFDPWRMVSDVLSDPDRWR